MQAIFISGERKALVKMSKWGGEKDSPFGYKLSSPASKPSQSLTGETSYPAPPSTPPIIWNHKVRSGGPDTLNHINATGRSGPLDRGTGRARLVTNGTHRKTRLHRGVNTAPSSMASAQRRSQSTLIPVSGLCS